MTNSLIINSSSQWVQSETSANANNTVRDAGSLVYSSTYGQGGVTGTGVINEIFHQYGVLPSGGTGNFNLQSLNQTLLSYSVNKAFVNVREIMIKNYSTTSGMDINVNVNSSSGFKEPFGYSSGSIRLGANSHIHRNDFYRGWDVTSSAKQIQLVDLGSGCTYEIVIAGCSG